MTVVIQVYLLMNGNIYAVVDTQPLDKDSNIIEASSLDNPCAPIVSPGVQSTKPQLCCSPQDWHWEYFLLVPGRHVGEQLLHSKVLGKRLHLLLLFSKTSRYCDTVFSVVVVLSTYYLEMSLLVLYSHQNLYLLGYSDLLLPSIAPDFCTDRMTFSLW